MFDFSAQQDFSEERQKLLAYAQLCNVFYERELKLLGELDESAEKLKKRLQSLPFYIKRAAETLLSLDNPLTLDTQNGTWSNKQRRRCPADKIDSEQNRLWLQKNAQIGLLVPVVKTLQGETSIRLDCIDALDENKVRLNEHGWFDEYGQCLQPTEGEKRLLRANKDLISAAACGHQWIGQDATLPRTLSLRELLLTTNINWKNLNKPKPLS
ncbi:hypothetical protein [Gayadomonas joobiniege]|uniref:hypothetical protein n=1 Tax=Gayadomonas joobiniege TaxID=1234606 RepID=UPI00036B28C3|nr:hypothetical protein [Gayadomonas joobiniege]